MAVDALPVGGETHRAVDRTGIHIKKAEFGRRAASERAFARAGGTVDRDRVMSVQVDSPYLDLYYSAAPIAQPAAWPVAQAICRLKPPV